MFDFLEKTEVNRNFPKESLYKNSAVSSKLKGKIVEQIKSIHWRNKLSANTINLSADKKSDEIHVFEISLKTGFIDNEILDFIDEKIYYYTLFVIEYNGLYQANIAYKEITDNKVNIIKRYSTDKMPLEDLPIKINGLSINTVYENFVRQVAGDRLYFESALNLNEAVSMDINRCRILSEIEKLEKKISKEKQFNIKIELSTQVKKLHRELEGFK